MSCGKPKAHSRIRNATASSPNVPPSTSPPNTTVNAIPSASNNAKSDQKARLIDQQSSSNPTNKMLTRMRALGRRDRISVVVSIWRLLDHLLKCQMNIANVIPARGISTIGEKVSFSIGR